MRLHIEKESEISLIFFLDLVLCDGHFCLFVDGLLRATEKRELETNIRIF